MDIGKSKPSVLLVDGYSLIYRGFHALPLLSSGGVYTNGVVGFFSMLLKALGDYRPDFACVMMDMKAPTFRHTIYDEYKATRKPMPEELRPQIPLVRDILSEMGIPIFEMEGYEADDLLGTAAYLAEERGLEAYILTGDRDSLQLVGGSRYVILTKTGISDNLLLDAEAVKSIYGYTPEQVTDMKGLMGDSSDNIPGIAGIGEKTALKLIGEYGTLENTLAHAGEVKGKLGEKLQNGRAAAEMSKELGTICIKAPLEIDFAACDWKQLLSGLAILEKYKLHRLVQSAKTLIEGRADATPGHSGTAEHRSSGAAKRAGAGKDIPATPAAPARTELAVEIPAFPPAQAQPPVNTMEAAKALAEQLATEVGVAVHFAEDAVSLALSDGRLYLIPLAVDMTAIGLYEDQAAQALKPLWEKGSLLVHGAKALFGKLVMYGLPVPSVAHDTMLGAYLLHSTQKSFSLPDSLAAEYGEISESPTAYDVYALAMRQKTLLKHYGMMELLLSMEQPLTRVLFSMEQEGFGIDRDALMELGRQFTTEIEELRQQVYDLTGEKDFNLNSPKQLGEVLFEKLGLPTGKKGKAGAYSTDASVLEGLASIHPAIEPLLRYRKLSKLQSTYIEGLARLTTKTDRVHTTFDQTATLTGRISSLEPNLQNIPVRSEEGREIRRAFVAKEGSILLDADYSQIELRVLAHLSGDTAMQDAFVRGQDIHTRTAAEIHGVGMEAVTPQMRREAKAVNFGIVYGISGFGLARNAGIGRKEADSFIAAYFDRYPKVQEYMKDMVSQGHEHGYVETLFGRRRELPELTSGNHNIRSFGERAAMNTPVQGTAADIIKLAMVRVAEGLAQGGFAAKLILQVHDELVVECPLAEVDAVSRLLQETMESVTQLSVPLVAEVSSGKSWLDAH